MSYCPKCGNQVDATMTFCPHCGNSLKTEAPQRPAPQQPTYQRQEKAEKHEKNEPEKGEKHEKGEFGHMGWLIAGVVIIIVGLLAYLRAANFIASQYESPVVLLVVGIAIIVIAIWLSTMARKRNPAPA